MFLLGLFLSSLLPLAWAQPAIINGGTMTKSEVCPAISFQNYLSQDGIYFQPSSGEIPAWVDLHFILNGGMQTNVRMFQTDTFVFSFPLNLQEGDRLEYFFTYCVFAGIDCDTETFSEVFSTPEPFVQQQPYQPAEPYQPRVASVQVPVDQVLYVGPPQPVKHSLPSPSWGYGPAAFSSGSWGGVTQPFEVLQAPSWGGHHGGSAFYTPISNVEPVGFVQPQAYQSWGGNGVIVEPPIENYAPAAFAGNSWGEPAVEPLVVQQEFVAGNTYVAHAPPPQPELPSWGIHAVQPVVAAQDFAVGSSWGGGGVAGFGGPGHH